MTAHWEEEAEVNSEDYCDCGNELKSDEEKRDGICEDCK
jgi:hypothetical protein